jgi:SNF2 family DNA or RNA helicase
LSDNQKSYPFFVTLRENLPRKAKMNLHTATPQQGQIVRVRSRQYLVDDVVSPPRPGDATLVRMACLDDDAQGQPLDVLWEKEVDGKILTGEAWQDLASRGFDPPDLFSAYLHTLQWNCVTATDPKLFHSPFRAGIQINAYQLEPLQKALLLPRVNLFIADDVGLGKTIEAGLIARELLLRRKVSYIVVVCPPSVLLQWKDELETRFGLVFEILDRAYFARVRQERGYGVNPFTTHTRFLISERLLVDETYATPLRDHLGTLLPGSLMIFDEAHHAAPSSGAKYAIDSKITRAIRELAQRFEHRLFLSATPHNGHSNSFSALLEILDPQRFCRGVPVRGKRLLEDVMVRRLKEDVRQVAGGFPKRTIKQIDIDRLPSDTPELRLSKLLNEYRQVISERLKGETKRKQAATGLLVSGLQQRLLSSIEAFSRTLRVHRRTVQRLWDEAQQGKTLSPERETKLDLDLLNQGVGSDDDRAELPEEELMAEEDAQMEAATLAAVVAVGEPTAHQLFAKQQKLLEEMTEIADAARGLPDARVARLVKWIRDNMCPGLSPLGNSSMPKSPLKWNNTRVLIFTEYVDTMRYLERQLSVAIAGTELAQARIATFHGQTVSTRREEGGRQVLVPSTREEIKRAFNTDPKKHPLRILIATDAAREGVNLQSHCSNLFHFDVPWNPSRLEQRNGRIDRKLQPAKEVFCHYFVYKQRIEDRILSVLVKKTETIKKELGSLSQVLEAHLADTLKHGIRHDEVEKLQTEIEKEDIEGDKKQTVAEELEEARERQDKLQEQLDELRTRLEDSKKWINLDEEQFRLAISSALRLMGAESIKSIANNGDGQHTIQRFEFPALDQRKGADPTWAETMDSLRAPREKDQSFWEWRRESPIRPVVFEDTGTMDDDVVHLHLEHRVVRRLFGRFMAQGFVHNDISRACLTHTTDAIPRILLLGRLVLYGTGATRLHEEIVPVTARWIDPSQRKGPLTPYAREAEAKTMDLLEQALLQKQGHPIGEAVVDKLKTTGPRDVSELLSHLEARGQELAQIATRQLSQRGDREAKQMADILQDQKKRISATVDKYRDPQLKLDLDQAETRQLQSNRRYWDKRLVEIDKELVSEPDRIRSVYDVKALRIEPVGLVYLWPVSG